MSLQQLCDLFELPAASVQSIVSRMMINDDLQATWIQPTGTIGMHKVGCWLVVGWFVSLIDHFLFLFFFLGRAEQDSILGTRIRRQSRKSG
jgi:hypothetical protein